jgi:hypothetical protein
MPHPFEAREISAWIEPARVDRAMRILSDPRLRPTRVGSDDARTRRRLAERFGAEAFDDLRQLAIATPSALWIDRSAPLDEREREPLASEDIAVIAGACSLSFLVAIPQCETAPSFRRMQTGRALLGVAEAFGRVEVFQAAVAVPNEHHLAEGLRVAAAAALAVLGPIDQVTAFGMREGTMTASVIGRRGLGTLAVGSGADATSFTLIGDGGLATVASALVAWRRRDGSWVEETRLPTDGDEPTIETILEAERPTARGTSATDDAHRRGRLRIAALADTIRLSARTAHSESVEAMLRGFGVDPVELTTTA